MHRRGFWITLLATSAASVGLLWLPCGDAAESWCVPLGIPGEWDWNRIPVDEGGTTTLLLGWSLAAIALLVYGVVVWIGATRLSNCSRTETAFWLVALATAGFCWLSLLQESPPEGYRTSKAVQVLYYPSSSGYFFEARYGLDDVSSFLGDYEQRMAEGDVLHVGTHPPGLFLFHRSLIQLCDRFPALTKFVLATQPESADAAGTQIARLTRGTTTRLFAPGRAALWLAALITQAVGVLAVVPLYLLIRRTHQSQASFLAVALWPLVPALAIFLPKSDALYPFIGLMFLYCWLEGCRRRSLLRCALAGLLFWLGMLLSLAILPVGLLALLLSVWETHADTANADGLGATGVSPVPSVLHWRHASGTRKWRQLCISAAIGAVTFLAATFALWVAFDLNLFNVWRWNVVNHSAFYDQFDRSYWKWLLVNPLELSLAIGLPVILLAFAGCRRAIGQSGNWRRGWCSAQLGPCVCCLMTIGLLWLSGKNSGEAARLWLFLMPWLIWLAADMFAGPAESSDLKQPTPVSAVSMGALAVIALQAIVCIATVTRVTGFRGLS
jgi:hypothetical protein